MCDFIVSYSLNEVFPLNIMEAFYCEKPVVSTNVGGISELITNGKTGFIFQKDDSQSCIKYLRLLIRYPVLC